MICIIMILLSGWCRTRMRLRGLCHMFFCTLLKVSFEPPIPISNQMEKSALHLKRLNVLVKRTEKVNKYEKQKILLQTTLSEDRNRTPHN